MNRLTPLPRIMVAPNGARRSKSDHPALPITISETVTAAKAAFAAGAQALHAHIRDAEGEHSLDPDGYLELIAQMARDVPDMPVQITSEAAGRFSAEEQRACVLSVKPEGASVALREIWPDDSHAADAKAFYDECAAQGIAIQHIVYTPEECARLITLVQAGALPEPVQAIFVLGAYASATPASPKDLVGYLDVLKAQPISLDWAACAFGPRETGCLLAAHRARGKMRIGFENNLTQIDGTLADDNAARVAELVKMLKALGPR